MSWLAPAVFSRIATRLRLVANGVESMRRAGKWSALPDYLSNHVGPGRIREEVHRFVVSVAWYHLDRARFLREALACRCGHPLSIFLRGLAQLREHLGVAERESSPAP